MLISIESLILKMNVHFYEMLIFIIYVVLKIKSKAILLKLKIFEKLVSIIPLLLVLYRRSKQKQLNDILLHVDYLKNQRYYG